VGGISAYFLIFPAERRSLQAEANQAQQSYFSSLNQLQDEIDRLESSASDWQSEKEELLAELESYTGAETNEEKYDRLLEIYALKAAGDDYHAMEQLQQMSPEGELSESFLQAYQNLMAEYSTEGVNRLYNEGVDKYQLAQYEEARDDLLMVLAWKADFPEAIFWLGLSYWNLADRDTAAQYLNQVIEQYPDHVLAAEAQAVLNGG
jgi:TolA-binding protein